jgi:hypothetical protein
MSQSSGSLRGVIVDQEPVVLRPKLPSAVMASTISLVDVISPAGAYPVSATIACAPSGSGEMTISGFAVEEGDSFVVTTSGGQPGRVYTLLFNGVMSDGQTLALVLTQQVTPVRDWDQATEPPSWGFGTAQSWDFLPTLDFSNLANSGYIALISGI